MNKKKRQENKKMNVLLISSKSSHDIECCEKECGNLNIRVSDRSIEYLNFLLEKDKLKDNVDLIVLYSSELYAEKELYDLKKLASDIAQNKDKRVSLGYSFIIPKDYVSQANVPFGIKVISYTKYTEIEEDMNGTKDFSENDLLKLASATHEAIIKHGFDSPKSPYKVTRKLKLINNNR